LKKTYKYRLNYSYLIRDCFDVPSRNDDATYTLLRDACGEAIYTILRLLRLLRSSQLSQWRCNLHVIASRLRRSNLYYFEIAPAASFLAALAMTAR